MKKSLAQVGLEPTTPHLFKLTFKRHQRAFAIFLYGHYISFHGLEQLSGRIMTNKSAGSVA